VDRTYGSVRGAGEQFPASTRLCAVGKHGGDCPATIKMDPRIASSSDVPERQAGCLI
jgi:hypothetical protein